VWRKTWHAAHDAHHDGALIMMQYAAMMSASSGAGILVLSHHVNFSWLCFAQSVLCCHDCKIEKGNYKIDEFL
jgi:hypothetical protein